MGSQFGNNYTRNRKEVYIETKDYVYNENGDWIMHLVFSFKRNKISMPRIDTQYIIVKTSWIRKSFMNFKDFIYALAGKKWMPYLCEKVKQTHIIFNCQIEMVEKQRHSRTTRLSGFARRMLSVFPKKERRSYGHVVN